MPGDFSGTHQGAFAECVCGQKSASLKELAAVTDGHAGSLVSIQGPDRPVFGPTCERTEA
jgi:hypothetical protein